MKRLRGGRFRLVFFVAVLAGLVVSCQGRKPLWLLWGAPTQVAPAGGAGETPGVRKEEGEEEVLRRIAFGSCNNESAPTPIWRSIVEFKPQLFVWLGDNIYADVKLPTRLVGPNRNAGPWKVKPRFLAVSREEMEEKYRRVKEHPEYVKLRKSAEVIGTWDDHDFGLNDAGREYAGKWQSQELALDFLDEPKDSPRRKQEGIYTSYSYGPPGKRVKVFMLDLRFHRSPIGSDGELLGEAQWAWLEKEVQGSDAQINIFGSSIQVLSNITATVTPLFSVESWARFPSSRARFFALLSAAKLSGVIFLSGDIHFGELSRFDCSSLEYPLYEVTSSGLSQSVEGSYGWPALLFIRAAAHLMPTTMRYYSNACRHRSCTYGRTNFGTLEIDWEAQPVMIDVAIRDERGDPVHHVRIPLSELQVGSLSELASGGQGRHCMLESDLPWYLRNLLPGIFFFVLFLGVVLLLLPCFFGVRSLFRMISIRKRKPD